MDRHQSWLFNILFCLSLVASFGTTTAYGQNDDGDTVTLETTVTGNQEQPKVLYIVPWKSPSGPDNLYRPLDSRLEHVFAPVERIELRRQLRYLDDANSTTDTPE